MVQIIAAIITLALLLVFKGNEIGSTNASYLLVGLFGSLVFLTAVYSRITSWGPFSNWALRWKECYLSIDETAALCTSWLVTPKWATMTNTSALFTKYWWCFSAQCDVFHGVSETSYGVEIKRHFSNSWPSHEFKQFGIVFNSCFLTPSWRGSVSRKGRALFAFPKTVIHLKSKCFKASFRPAN